MKTKMKRICAMLLAIVLCMSIEIPASASEVTEKETIWKGDSISKEITAGEKGYIFCMGTDCSCFRIEFGCTADPEEERDD